MGRYVVRRPEEAAMARLLERHAFDAAGTAVRLAWQAGLLRGEIAALTWERVSFLNQEIELEDRTVPLSAELEEYLTALSRRQNWASSHVLLSDHRRRPLQPQPISLLVRNALDKVGQTEVRLMDLRHDFIIRQLETHDWQYVSRITGMDAAALNLHFAPYLSAGVSTRIKPGRKAPRLDVLRLQQLLQDEGDSEVGRAIRLAWQGGLRLSDIANLTWKQVDFGNKILITSDGPVPMDPELEDFLKNLAGKPEETVILSPRTRRPMLPERISRVVRGAMVRAGLDNASLLDLQKDHAARTGGEQAVLAQAGSAGCVTRNQVMETLGLTRAEAYALLSRLTDRGSLTRIGTRYYPAEAVVPPERQYEAVRAYLEREGAAYRQDLARLLRVEPRQCTVILNRLVRDGKLVRDKQRYTLGDA